MKREQNSKLQIRNSTAEFLIFVNQTGGEDIEVRLQAGSVWLPQKLIAALFAFFLANFAWRGSPRCSLSEAV
jgi:hypothetical protein